MLLTFIANIHGSFLWNTKRGITITNAFQKNLDESHCKPSKILVDKGNAIYHRSMKLWLEDNDTEMNSTQNEGKSAVIKRFTRTLKTWSWWPYKNIKNIKTFLQKVMFHIALKKFLWLKKN